MRFLKRSKKLNNRRKTDPGNGQDLNPAKSSLEERELNFRSIFEAMTEGAAIHRMIYDKNGKAVDFITLEFNHSYEKMLGIPPDKAKGNWGRVLYGSESSSYLDIFENVLRTGRPYYFTVFSEPLNRHFEISVFRPRKDLFATVFIDVTGSKRAAEELRMSRHKYRRLYESMMDGFVFTDMNGTIREFNPRFRDMLDFTEEELLKLSHQDITPEQWHAYEKRIIDNQVIPYGYSRVFEKEYRKKDGMVFPIELRISLVKDEHGKPEGMLAIVRDITDRKRSEHEFEQMIDRFNLAARSANLGVWELEIQSSQLFWDDKMFELFDIGKEEFSGTSETWFNLLHPDDIADFTQQIESAIRGEKEFEDEFRVIFKDGSIHTFKAFAQVVRDSHGIPHRMTGINFDITEQKRTQESLIISEMFNRGLVESAPVGIFFLDKDHKITFANPAIQTMLSLPEGTASLASGIVFQEHPQIKESLSEGDIASIIQGEPLNGLNIHYRSLAGKELDLEIYTAPLLNMKGETHGTILMAVDITEQVATNEELRKSEQKYRKLFDSMRDGFVMLDMQNQITEVNSSFLAITGYTLEELFSIKRIRSIIPEKWYAGIDKILQDQLLVNDYTDVFELEFLRKDGIISPMEIRLFLIKNEQGENEKIWGIVRDITERKRMENEVREMNSVLEEKVKEKTKELQERVMELERFNKATIDRELRMKDLRTRIEELEKKLINKIK